MTNRNLELSTSWRVDKWNQSLLLLVLVVTGYITQAVISCVIAEREARQLIMQCGG